MAEIDEFVLKYTVELGATIERLSSVKKAMEDLGSTSGKSTTGFTDIVSSALKAKKGFEGLTSGLSGALNLFVKLPGPLKAAAALLIGVAEAIKLINASLREYNEQRQVAIASGMGYLGVENFQRNMVSASGGFVGAAESQGILRNVSQMGLQAYQDPYQWNRQARILQMAGAQISGPGGGIADVNDQMAQIAERFKSMTEVQARAMGQLMGISQNAADAMHQLGKAIVGTTKMTDSEAIRHKEATQASIRLQAAYNNLDESGRRLRDAVTDELLPAYAKLMEMFGRISEIVVKFTTNVFDLFSGIGRYVDTLLTDIKLKMEGSGESIKQIFDDASKAYEKPPETAADITAAEGEENRQQRELFAKWSRDINLFSQAVGQFAGIVDDKQAWAAWAGTVGAAGGLGTQAGAARLRPGEAPEGAALTVNNAALSEALGGPGTGVGGAFTPGGETGGVSTGGAPTGETRGIRNMNPGNIEYGEFARKWGATGIEPAPGDGGRARFAVFPSLEMGARAARALVGQKYLKQANPTVESVIKAYAGVAENDIPAYVAAINKITGLTGSTPVTSDNIDLLTKGMLQYESGYTAGVPGAKGQAGAAAAAAATKGKSIMGGHGWSGAITGASPAAAPTDGGAPTAGDNAQSPGISGSGPMQYAFDPSAKPVFQVTGPDTVPIRTVDQKPTGYLPQNIGRQTVAQWLDPYLRNVPVSAILRGSHVGSADIQYAESQVASEAMKSEMVGLAKFKALQGQTFPGADIERGKIIVQLRSAEAVMTNLLRYGPGLARHAAQTTERTLTYGERPVQINIYGAADSKEIANEVHRILTGHYADVENGSTTKMKK